MTKEQFVTELIRGLQANEKVKEVHGIYTGTVVAETVNGDTFVIVVSKKQRR